VAVILDTREIKVGNVFFEREYRAEEIGKQILFP
jgi:hypothetical protein